MLPFIAQRITIKFLAHDGFQASEIFRTLTAQFNFLTLSKASVFAWHKKFMEFRERVENQEHDRRPRASVADENIRTDLEDDRWMSNA